MKPRLIGTMIKSMQSWKIMMTVNKIEKIGTRMMQLVKKNISGRKFMNSLSELSFS